MEWGRLTRLGWGGMMVLALSSAGWGEMPAPGEASYLDDSDRLYFQFVAGMNFTLDKPFAGDVEIAGEPDFLLGGSVGYNISRHWGVELQFQGGEPDLDSASLGKIREISVITVVPAARYRWHLLDDQLVPYVTGGVGMSISDVNEDARPFTRANTDSSTVVGSLSAGFDWFLSENVAIGLEGRYLIHPNQDAEVAFQAPSGRVTRFEDDLNLTSISLLAQIRMFPGQQAAPGRPRRLFLADDGPFDTDERRLWVAGWFGYDFLFSRNAGGGARLRDEGGDFNLTRGGGVGFNFDRHWGVELQVLATPLNLRVAGLEKIAEVNDTAFLPTLRWRWPWLDGRLVTFLTAGLGVAMLEVNDPRLVLEVPDGRGGATQVQAPKWSPDDRPLMVGAVGAGVEYFLNRHLSVGLYVPVHMYQQADTTVRYADGRVRRGTVDFSGVLALLQLKAYL